jgi:hypothetical protein
MSHDLGLNDEYEALSPDAQITRLLAAGKRMIDYKRECNIGMMTAGNPSRESLEGFIKATGAMRALVILGRVGVESDEQIKKEIREFATLARITSVEEAKRATIAWDTHASGEEVPDEFRRWFSKYRVS